MEDLASPWHTASFSAGWPSRSDRFTLSVSLARANPMWLRFLRHQLDRTAGEVRRGSWGDITLSENAIEVKDVAQGSQEPLRAFLDSMASKANESLADYRRRDEEDRRARSSEEEKQRGVADEMTASIRSIA